jgi:hypothetical protein
MIMKIKKLNAVDLIALGAFAITSVIGILWAVATPAEPRPECTSEYIAINGQYDCEAIQRADRRYITKSNGSRYPLA